MSAVTQPPTGSSPSIQDQTSVLESTGYPHRSSSLGSIDMLSFQTALPPPIPRRSPSRLSMLVDDHPDTMPVSPTVSDRLPFRPSTPAIIEEQLWETLHPTSPTIIEEPHWESGHLATLPSLDEQCWESAHHAPLANLEGQCCRSPHSAGRHQDDEATSIVTEDPERGDLHLSARTPELGSGSDEISKWSRSTKGGAVRSLWRRCIHHTVHHSKISKEFKRQHANLQARKDQARLRRYNLGEAMKGPRVEPSLDISPCGTPQPYGVWRERTNGGEDGGAVYEEVYTTVAPRTQDYKRKKKDSLTGTIAQAGQHVGRRFSQAYKALRNSVLQGRHGSAPDRSSPKQSCTSEKPPGSRSATSSSATAVNPESKPSSSASRRDSGGETRR